MMIRQPVVCGSFYPARAEAIRRLLSEVQNEALENLSVEYNFEKIIGGILPHAGYIYSAYETAHFFELLKGSSEPIDTFVIIHPDHFGMGEEVSVDGHDAWRTPLGQVSVDKELRKAMDLDISIQSESREHSAEVILPFLQYYLKYDYKILPVSMKRQSYENSKTLATKLWEAKRMLKKRLMVIASSDFSHFVKPEIGFYYDSIVLDRILNFDQTGLYETVIDNKLTVCGYGPILTLMFYAQLVHESPQVKILARGNSSKRHYADLVVDYVSAVFFS